MFGDYVREVCEGLDYRNLNIYAEGTWEKCENLREYLLRSVSVEFECIDIIYESNIKKGIIKDTTYGLEELLKKFKESERIVLKDIGEGSLAACNLFLENGIEHICFLTKNEDNKQLIGGMHMFTMNDLRKLSEKIVFVDCLNEHSAWGPDELDYYDYIGYRRNEQYFCLRDYIDLPYSDLKNLLCGKDIVLVGDVLLCKKFYLYYKQKMKCRSIVYYNILDDNKAHKYHDMMPLAERAHLKKSDLFLIYAFEYYYSNKEVREHNKQNKNNIAGQVYADQLCQEGYYNYLLMYNEIPDDQIVSDEKYTAHELKPKLIMAGALLGDCGNVLLRNMLSGHGKIIKMKYGFLNGHLILFCIRLSGEKASDILSMFWELVAEAVGTECIGLEFHDTALFHKKMAEMLQIVSRPTSQELFVIFHLAYVAMYGTDISDVSDYMIFWERHGIRRVIHPKHIKWLDAEGIEGLVITNSRNSIVRAGGLLKYLKARDYFKRTDSFLLRTVLEEPEEWNEKESVWESLEIKFEELKCNPQEVMDKIGDKAGVSFSEILDGSIYGGQVKYSDMEQIMKPVYNAYEEYLSLFDKMRISLLTLNWQKKRDYPLVDYSEITRKDLQEMFLREFRFEKELVFSSEEEYLRYRQGRQRWLRQRFSSLRFQNSKQNFE